MEIGKFCENPYLLKQGAVFEKGELRIPTLTGVLPKSGMASRTPAIAQGIASPIQESNFIEPQASISTPDSVAFNETRFGQHALTPGAAHGSTIRIGVRDPFNPGPNPGPTRGQVFSIRGTWVPYGNALLGFVVPPGVKRRERCQFIPSDKEQSMAKGENQRKETKKPKKDNK